MGFKLRDIAAAVGRYARRAARMAGRGAKRRAIHARAIDVMPDNVERDKDGREISRTRSATLRDHHRWAGVAPRYWG